MNLLIKTLYLFIILLAGKVLVPKYVKGTMEQNVAFLGLLYLANVVYRVSVNYYFSKKTSLSDVVMESTYRTILIVVGIVIVNYLISNPQILKNYGIDVPETNIYTSTAVSLVPFLLTKSLLSPDI